uniref:MADS5 n=1 Tax=Apostasia odorata TaxID=280455 RepID=A0A1L1WKY7_9ASPA|nr:MADS5 [Apostasia odorata]
MEAAGLGALNLRCNLVHFRSCPVIRPVILADLMPNGKRSPVSRILGCLSFIKEGLRSRPSLYCFQPLAFADSHCNGTAGSADEVSFHKLLHVVLVSPQIPGNTGSIARTCAASAVGLHLVEPLGYKINDTKLKRAGLDYWPYVVVKVHKSWVKFREYFRQQEGNKRLLAFTKRGTHIHSDFTYRSGDWLVFGSETSGLPPEALLDCSREGMGGGAVRIPMVETHVRSLNLSVSVGIALYEAARQLNYEQLRSPADLGTENQSLFIKEDHFA